MDNKERAHIEKIRDDFNGSQRIKDSLNNSLEALAEDLYGKDTHFIFELLQNAEDNKYEKVKPSLSFLLTKVDPTRTQGSDGALIISNNELGFYLENVEALCNVGKTTKDKMKGYIGEKGIGFKSVFRVTSRPFIFSNGYSFCLPEKDEETGLGYIVPQWIEECPAVSYNCQTTIILPLNKTDFGYNVVEEMLRDIEPETILFLSKIKDIHIQTASGDDLCIIKNDSQQPLVEILIEGKKQDKSYSVVQQYLLYTESFEKPDNISYEKREDIEERDVSIGLSLNTESKSVGKVFAYLPVRSDTVLPFLINADFILPSSREDIKDVAWNHWLMECVSTLVIELLVGLRTRGKLTVAFLEMLVCRIKELDDNSRFHSVAQAVARALMSKELLPADDGTFISPSNAKLPRSAELRSLLNQDQLSLLFKSVNTIKWLSADITPALAPSLHSYFIGHLQVEEVRPELFCRRLTLSFISEQPDNWFVEFYKYLLSGPSILEGILRNKPILRLQDNTIVSPFDDDGTPCAYLPAESDTDLPVIKRETVADNDALNFLKKMKIPELDMVAEVLQRVLPKYHGTLINVSFEEHRRDIKKILDAFSTDSQDRKNLLYGKLKATPFVYAKNLVSKQEAYMLPETLYLKTNDLVMYFEGNKEAWFVSPEYSSSVQNMFEEIGIHSSVFVKNKQPDWRGTVIISDWHSNHKRGLKGFDPQAEVFGLKYAISNPTAEKSQYVWNDIAIPHVLLIRGIVESSTRQEFVDSTQRRELSDFGKVLRCVAWLPDANGIFHTPEELYLDDLPESFIRNDELAEQLGMKRDVVAMLAEKAGIPFEHIDFIKQHPEEFQNFQTTFGLQTAKPIFPTATSQDPERREALLRDQSKNANKKEYEKRNRNVRTTRGTIDPDLWLRERYTNNIGQMVCQICKKEMPFKKRDDEYYFDAVEVFTQDLLPSEHEAQFLALCPLCSAMYKEFVKRDERASADLRNVLLQPTELKFPISLGNLHTTIQFVESHAKDLQVVLHETGEEENDIRLLFYCKHLNTPTFKD